jgi:integrase
MKPIERPDGRWMVFIPAKLSDSGKREAKYYATKKAASDAIADFKEEKREHGKQAVSSDDRVIVGLLRKELGGDLSILPEILRHWKRTGEKLNQIEVKDAIQEFTDSAEKDYPNHRTLNDIKERLENFKAAFSSRLVHELSPTDIERFLEGYSAGWDRWSYHKRLGPFFKMAKRRRWIAMNPMEEVPKPKTPTPEREIYSSEQFHNLLQTAEVDDEYTSLVPYIVLSGFCFLRTAELIRMYEAEKVLRWENVLWDDGLIHVPPGVAKSTRRESGDERYIPLNDAAKAWLDPIREKSGDCVSHSASKFGQLWRKMTDEKKIPRIDNGLRHSAISYSLAAHPEHGVALTSQWAGNSEKTIRKHYRRLLKPEQGKAWFEVRPTFL